MLLVSMAQLNPKHRLMMRAISWGILDLFEIRKLKLDPLVHHSPKKGEAKARRSQNSQLPFKAVAYTTNYMRMSDLFFPFHMLKLKTLSH